MRNQAREQLLKDCRAELIEIYKELGYISDYSAPEQLPNFGSRQIFAVVNAMSDRLEKIEKRLDDLENKKSGPAFC